jgi:hypothetical protein
MVRVLRSTCWKKGIESCVAFGGNGEAMAGFAPKDGLMVRQAQVKVA